MNEFDIIRRFFDRGPARRAELGIGDDAAVMDMRGASLAVCTDMLVQGRHFFADADPASVGFKSVVVNLSDLAAMGATPEAFTLALALPEVDENWLEKFSTGVFEAADMYQCELIGGDTTRGPLTISVTAHGSLPAGSAIRRDGAEPGEDIWVSGCLGAAAAQVLARLAGNPDLPDAAIRRLDWPQAQVRLGGELRHIASAAIDVSDGLIADLAHIAERSRVAMRVLAADVPVDPVITDVMAMPDAIQLALCGGDDYELAFTSATENRLAIEGIATRLRVPLTRIGSVHAGQGVHVVDATGATITDLPGGHDHFA